MPAGESCRLSKASWDGDFRWTAQCIFRTAQFSFESRKVSAGFENGRKKAGLTRLELATSCVTGVPWYTMQIKFAVFISLSQIR